MSHLTTPRGSRPDEEVKTKFQVQNKRLEYYILKQREKEEQLNRLKREFETAKVEALEGTEALKKQNADELERLRLDRLDVESRLRAKDEELGCARSRELELTKMLESGEQNKGAFDLKLNSMMQINNEVLAAIQAAEEQERQQKQKNSSLDEREHLLAQELQRLRDQLYHNRCALERQKEVVSDLRDQIANEGAKIQRELQDQKINDLAHLQQAVASEDFAETERCAAIIDELQREHDEKSRIVMDELRNAYESKLGDYHDQLEDLGHHIAVLHDENRNAHELELNAAALADQARQLRAEVEGASAKTARLMSDKMRILRELQENLRLKEEENDRLFDANIQLQKIINSMSAMLDGEEHRLDVVTGEETDTSATAVSPATYQPAKKRSRLDSEVASPDKKLRRESTPLLSPMGSPPAEADVPVVEQSKAAVVMDDDEPMIDEVVERSNLVSGHDVYGDYVTLCNASANNYESMKGWRLIFTRTNIAFEFPDVPLNSDDTFQIRMTDTPPVGFGDDGKGGLVPVGAWHPVSDEATLLNPEGGVEAEFDIVQETTESNNKEDESGCVVM